MAFDDAIKAAVETVNLRETLIIVVAFRSQRMKSYSKSNRFRKNLQMLEKASTNAIKQILSNFFTIVLNPYVHIPTTAFFLLI